MARLRGWFMLAFLSVTQAWAGPVTLEHTTFEGWPESRRITNGVVDLVFVPLVGRIMRYGYVNGPNVLWVDHDIAGTYDRGDGSGHPWANYGGDKLWPAPQSVWGFPPDPVLDGKPWRVRDLPGGRIEATSYASAQSGICFRRIISLASTGTEVTIRNIMECTGPKPVSWGIWEVAQVDNPEWCAVPLSTPKSFPADYYAFPGTPPPAETVRVTAGEARMTRHRSLPGKIGSNSPRRYARASLRGTLFTLSARLERPATYPDEGCSSETYGSPDPTPYMELELLGPLRTLKPGGRQELVTHWRLR